MVALLLIGLTWVVLYYVAASTIGFVSALGAWNIAHRVRLHVRRPDGRHPLEVAPRITAV